MLYIHGEDQENDTGADPRYDGDDRRRRGLEPPLQIPKNRSTGNLALVGDNSDRLKIRYSLDAGAAAADYDTLTRGPLMTDHDHGLGLSGLRRIRQQHNPLRTPTLPSPTSRSPSMGDLTRSSSMTMMMEASGHAAGLSSGPSSPAFTEDLSRFPSESLHSFSFAHQSEDFIHSRQNVLKRSIEFMKDKMGRPSGSNGAIASTAAIASAQARLSGDVEAQSMLHLLAKAHLVGAGNLPHADPDMLLGPLSGPADMSGENVFDKQFLPRTMSPEMFEPNISPTTTRAPSFPGPLDAVPDEDEEKPVGLQLPRASNDPDSENSSRTPTNESGTTAKTSPPMSRRPTALKRTMTDTFQVSIQQKLMDVMAKPYLAGDQQDLVGSPTLTSTSRSFSSASLNQPAPLRSSIHGHSTRWVPAAQAIFTTEVKPPWTIMAANDLACLVFGFTKAEIRKMGILEVVQEERRAWLEQKLSDGRNLSDVGDGSESEITVTPPTPIHTTSLLGARGGGITAKLLSKPNSRSTPPAASRRPATVHSGDPKPPKPGQAHHSSSKSRGVLLCGDVVPIQKRNGATGAASLWVKEKKVGLIWVLEEIHEDVVQIELDEDGIATKLTGALSPIWGDETLEPGTDIGRLIPRIPRQGFDPRYGAIDYAQIRKWKYFTCRNSDNINIPATVDQVRGSPALRVSSFPHIAGIIVVETTGLTIKSSNSVFCRSLFGHDEADGLSINTLLPNFDKVLRTLIDEDGIQLVDGIVIPEHSFRKAAAFLALKEGQPNAATNFLRPEGLLARHRDGSELKIDVQMRVVKSEKQTTIPEETVVETDEDDSGSEKDTKYTASQPEMVFALWITYSRHLHATRINLRSTTPLLSGSATPLHQPSPGQTPVHSPVEIQSDSEEPKKIVTILAQQIKEAAMTAAAVITGTQKPAESKSQTPAAAKTTDAATKKSIDEFIILEDMGQGAYGQVKLARYRENGKKCVLKYVTKKRILVDTWTRDRKLGTVPLEIHVLDYLRREDFRHPNIVEMEDFFEDSVNYYIEMVPHGLPGMDLFDYIELRANMEEQECRSIFVQVVRAIHHLHTKALVVHRDIKDENVILDGEGNIKLIDFGSAAYVKSGPFDVFVGTIDYAAPEVLAGKPYRGKEQDVWALGILLYTIIYKENPFYSIDEIMDRDLRVPYTISDESIGLIRCMLDRDVAQRYTIEQVLDHPWCQMDEQE